MTKAIALLIVNNGWKQTNKNKNTQKNPRLSLGGKIQLFQKDKLNVFTHYTKNKNV